MPGLHTGEAVIGLHIAPPQTSCRECGFRGMARLATRPRNWALTLGVPLALALAYPPSAVIAVLLFFLGLTWTLLDVRPVCPRCGTDV